MSAHPSDALQSEKRDMISSKSILYAYLDLRPFCFTLLFASTFTILQYLEECYWFFSSSAISFIKKYCMSLCIVFDSYLTCLSVDDETPYCKSDCKNFKMKLLIGFITCIKITS